jgi:glycerol dehydrogenase
MLTVFCSPARYVQGPDATSQLGAQMQAVGLTGRAYIVASPRASSSMSAQWERSLGQAGIDWEVAEFGGECCDAEIDLHTTQARDREAAVIVGVGGGKTLDTARAVAANLALPVVDTTLIAKAPRRYLVSGMGDALATWYEARTVIEAHRPNQVHGGTSASAGALAQLCAQTLYADGPAAVAAVDAGAVTAALERVVEANTLLSGLGFESGGLAIAHSVHNGLTTAAATHTYLHGEKVSFGLVVQLVVEGRPTAEIDEVIGFCRTVGLPTRLSDLGLSAEDVDALQVVARRTVAPGETAHNEPFDVTAQMILDGILAADAYAKR